MPAYSQSQAFLDHLCAAHGRLGNLRHAVVDYLERLPPNSGLEGVAERLRELHAELVQHFRQEEEGGCLEEGVFYCPRLGQRLAELEREHDWLLGSLEELIARCSTDSSLTVSEVAEAFAEWSDALHAHARSENELVAEAFGQSLPVDECC